MMSKGIGKYYKISEDGEVLVKGPQVMKGYFGEDVESPLHNGWLHTGDLGELTAEGSLIIKGRKKEIIVTSYGKNIHPLKIEGLLRDIQCVSEAMMVGEGKPYCGALLWVNKKKANYKFIDRAVFGLNKRLSHPEQLKCWAILDNDLSIENGDLTGSLKIKRDNIRKRYKEVIEALYEKGSKTKDILHMGTADGVAGGEA